MAVKYGEFKFKSEHGFTGSAGKKHVRGYVREAYSKGGYKPPTQDSRQTLMEGVEPFNQKKWMETQAEKKLKPKTPQKDPNDIFQPLAPDLFDMKKRGGKVGYAEGGKFRSERTEEAKASREVQDSALAPSRVLNKSIKNMIKTRQETGYNSDIDYPGQSTPSFARGGKMGVRKMRSDKGFTQEIPTPRMGRQMGSSMPGTIGTPDVGALDNPTQMDAPSLGRVAAMKMGGRTKRK